MSLSLNCLGRREGGEYDSRQAGQDAARRLRWAIGQDEARECLARAQPPTGQDMGCRIRVNRTTIR